VTILGMFFQVCKYYVLPVGSRTCTLRAVDSLSRYLRWPARHLRSQNVTGRTGRAATSPSSDLAEQRPRRRHAVRPSGLRRGRATCRCPSGPFSRHPCRSQTTAGVLYLRRTSDPSPITRFAAQKSSPRLPHGMSASLRRVPAAGSSARGGVEVHDVECAVGRAGSGMLLGQSVLKRFPKLTIDNDRHVLTTC